MSNLEKARLIDQQESVQLQAEIERLNKALREIEYGVSGAVLTMVQEALQGGGE